MGVGFDADIGPPHSRPQKCARRRHAASVPGRKLVVADAVLFRAIEIGVEPKPRSLRRVDEDIAKRMHVASAAADVEGAAAPAKRISALCIVLHRPVSLEHFLPTPAGIAGNLPVFEVLGMAADMNHGVDRTRATQHLAARPVVFSSAQTRIRLGLIHPVQRGIVEGLAVAERHLDIEAPVAAARLEHQHPVAAAGRKPVGQHAARRSRAYDDEVVHQIDRPPGEQTNASPAAGEAGMHSESFEFRTSAGPMVERQRREKAGP